MFARRTSVKLCLGITYQGRRNLFVWYSHGRTGFLTQQKVLALPPARKIADGNRKAQINALCCTPPIRHPLNSLIMRRGEVAILYIPELLQVPELTGIDCLCLLILVGDD